MTTRSCRYADRLAYASNDSVALGARAIMSANSVATSAATCQLARGRAKGKTKRQSLVIMSVHDGLSASS